MRAVPFCGVALQIQPRYRCHRSHYWFTYCQFISSLFFIFSRKVGFCFHFHSLRKYTENEMKKIKCDYPQNTLLSLTDNIWHIPQEANWWRSILHVTPAPSKQHSGASAFQCGLAGPRGSTRYWAAQGRRWGGRVAYVSNESDACACICTGACFVDSFWGDLVASWIQWRFVFFSIQHIHLMSCYLRALRFWPSSFEFYLLCWLLIFMI